MFTKINIFRKKEIVINFGFNFRGFLYFFDHNHVQNRSIIWDYQNVTFIVK